MNNNNIQEISTPAHTPADTPKLIINPIGGLANRMRLIASGLTLAEELACDTRIIWQNNAELKANPEDIFEIPPYMAKRLETPGSLKYYLMYSQPRKKNLYASALTAPLLFGRTLRDSDPELLKILENDDFKEIKHLAASSISRGKDCLMQGGIVMYPFTAHLYKSLFRPAEAIRKRVDETMQALGENTVGLHIRRTDNAQSILHSPDSLFMEEIDAELEKLPDTRFYLATDDEETKKRFSARYGNRISYSSVPAGRDTPEGIKDAATEMFILSRTRRIIGSYYSSFSEAAAMLGDIPVTQVFRK